MRSAGTAFGAVTLRVRVWIETKGLQPGKEQVSGHPPREGVD